MKSKKNLILHDSKGKRVRVIFDNRKLFNGLLNAIDNDNLQREDLAYVIAQILRSLSSSSEKVEFRNEKLEDKKLDNKGVPSPQDEDLKPFTPALSKIRLSKIRLNKNENAVLAKFLDAVMRAESLDELNRIVYQALNSGIRINAPNKGLWCFADAVLFRILDTFPEGAQDIMHKLILSGATFDDDLLQFDERINKTHNQLQQELQLQLHDQLTELRKVAENAAICGTIRGVEFDNRTFYMEFSENSVVDIGKITGSTRELGFDNGNLKLGGDIVKIGESEVEVKAEADGKINYLGLSDNSSVKITFHTNRGDLNINLFHNQNNHNDVQVRVDNTKLWDELKTSAVVKNCLLGGIPIEKAVEKGSFVRCGRLGIEKDPIKDTWVNRVRKSNETTCLVL